MAANEARLSGHVGAAPSVAVAPSELAQLAVDGVEQLVRGFVVAFPEADEKLSDLVAPELEFMGARRHLDMLTLAPLPRRITAGSSARAPRMPRRMSWAGERARTGTFASAR